MPVTRNDIGTRSNGRVLAPAIANPLALVAVGLPLRPTDLLIFGAAEGGTPLMQSVQTIGIDLPLKALVWRDEAGTTFLSYNGL